ncbi:MAG: hypothetical protein Kow0062_16720 [Acidobacteriota bacterium]
MSRRAESTGPGAAIPALCVAVALLAGPPAACGDGRGGTAPREETEVNEPRPDGEVAVVAGGCFWCLDAVFRRIDGVTAVRVGYAGGHVDEPTYEQVCSGETGHAEAVEVTFDPGRISYREILEIFFAMHDPTTLNRQGADVGTQYRSAIFWRDERQRDEARALVRELTDEKVFDAPIVTEIAPLERFWAAEAYHQDYYARNTQQGYCRLVISPKLSKLRARFAHRWREPIR